MKHIRLYTLLLLGLMIFNACSSDDDPVSKSFVSFQEAQMNVKETQGLFQVPIIISGNHENDIVVEVSVQPSGSNAAEENVNYIVTSEKINFPAGVNSGFVEISAVDDHKFNEHRKFFVNIEKVVGARLGNVTTTKIILLDNDRTPYERFFGNWDLSFTYTPVAPGLEPELVTTPATTILENESSPAYEKFLRIKFNVPYQVHQYGVELDRQDFDISPKFEYEYDKDTNKGALFMVCNMQPVAHMGNFGFVLGNAANGSFKLPCEWEENEEGDIVRISSKKGLPVGIYMNFKLKDQYIPLAAGQYVDFEFVRKMD